MEYIRRRPKPLALYVFSRSGSTVEETLQGTTSGGVCVNNTLLHLANPRLPFGGVGPSGIGNYHGRAGFRAFSHERAVMRQQGNPLARLLAPPYSGRMNRMVARFARFLQ
jgi:aldehyde dehydrogenase (NAD+)